MRILYITFENPAVYTILNGMHDEELDGLPAFYFPFRMLTERGHRVEMLLVSDRDFEVKKSSGFDISHFHLLKIRNRGMAGKLEVLVRIVKKVRRLLKENRYDFVYGMGEGTYPAVYTAYKMGVAAALRQYGTQEMANVLEGISGKAGRLLKAAIDYPYITLSMNGKMNFLLATNDGSRADELYDLLGIRRKKFDFYFWRSGVYIPQTRPEPDVSKDACYPMAYDPMHLSHIGRIVDVKRQDRSVRILGELHRRGYPFHLHFVGSYSSGSEMVEKVHTLAREYGVEDYIHFEGSQPQSVCRLHGRNALATLLVCEWNRVNIFYEVMGEGAVVLTNNNHSIDEFIEDGVNCLVYEEDNYAQAADWVIALLENPERARAIRKEAYRTASEQFMSLEKRFGLEVKLIEDTAAGKNTDAYPPVL